PVALDAAYPWTIWLTWELEERLIALGASATLCEDQQHAALAQRDLHAMTQWPTFEHATRPGLAFGHVMRTMHHAAHHWHWLDKTVLVDLRAACRRAVDQFAAWSDEHHTRFDQPLHDVSPDMLRLLHNIP